MADGVGAADRIRNRTYLLFVDADMVLTPTGVEECVAASQRKLQALVIPEVFVGKSYWARVRAFERGFYDDVWWIEAARWISRDVFFAVGRFDTQLVGPEDWDLDQKVRTSVNVGRISACIEHQEGDVTLRRLLQKKRHYAPGLRYFAVRHPERARLALRATPRVKLFGRHADRFLRHPLLGFGTVVLGLAEISVARVAWLQETSSDEAPQQ